MVRSTTATAQPTNPVSTWSILSAGISSHRIISIHCQESGDWLLWRSRSGGDVAIIRVVTANSDVHLITISNTFKVIVYYV